MAYGSAYVNAKNLKRQAAIDRERIAAQREIAYAQIAQRDRQASQQQRQFDATQELAHAELEQRGKSAADTASYRQTQLDNQAQGLKLEQGRLDISAAQEGRAAESHEFDMERKNRIRLLENDVFDQIVQNPGAVNGDMLADDMWENLGKMYAAAGDADMAKTFLELADRDIENRFKDNIRTIHSAQTALSIGDTDRAAELFAQAYNEIEGIDNGEMVDPNSFKAPSEENPGSPFSFDLINVESGERRTMVFQQQEELFSWMMSPSPTTRLDFDLKQNQAVRTAQAAAKTQRDGWRKDALDMATKEMETLNSALVRGTAGPMSKEEYNATLDEIATARYDQLAGIEDLPPEGYGSPTLQQGAQGGTGSGTAQGDMPEPPVPPGPMVPRFTEETDPYFDMRQPQGENRGPDYFWQLLLNAMPGANTQDAMRRYGPGFNFRGQ